MTRSRGISRRGHGRADVKVTAFLAVLFSACGGHRDAPLAPASGLDNAGTAAQTAGARPGAAQPGTPMTIDGYAIELLALTEQPALTVRGQAPPTELENKLAVDIPRLLAYALANRLEVAGPPFVRYLTRSDTRIEYEAGLPVLRPGEGTDVIAPTSLPAGPAVATVHTGPYQQLPAAHAALEAWRVQHRRIASGPGWDVFLTNPLQEPDPARWRTKVFLPLQPEPAATP